MCSNEIDDIAKFIHQKCKVSIEELLDKFPQLSREEMEKNLFILQYVLSKPEIYYIHNMYVSKHCKHMES